MQKSLQQGLSDRSVRIALVGPAKDILFRAEAMRRVHGGRVKIMAESMQDALASGSEFDAVVLHAPADARDAAEAGKHVLVDAPIAETTAEAESLLASVQQARVVFEVAGLPRHAPANQVIIDRLTSGKLGEPGLLRVHRWSSSQEQSLVAKIFGDIDLAISLFNSTPTEVYAIGRGNRSYLQIHLGFPNGGMAVLDFAERLPSERGYDSVSLIGSTGAAYADDHHNTHLLFAGTNPTALISDSSDGCLLELQAFVDKMSRGDSPSVDVQNLLSVHRVVDAVSQSIEATQALQARGGVYEPA